jgi:hypothetical protein
MKAIEKVISLERKALDGWSRGIPENYLIHVHPDIIYFDNLGAQDLIEGAENMTAYVKKAFAQLQPHTYDMVGLKARQYGDTVVLSYRYHPSLPDGTPGTQWAATVIYAITDSKWQLVQASWVMLQPPDMA